jgi:hypothetical protein
MFAVTAVHLPGHHCDDHKHWKHRVGTTRSENHPDISERGCLSHMVRPNHEAAQNESIDGGKHSHRCARSEATAIVL